MLVQEAQAAAALATQRSTSTGKNQIVFYPPIPGQSMATKFNYNVHPATLQPLQPVGIEQYPKILEQLTVTQEPPTHAHAAT